MNINDIEAPLDIIAKTCGCENDRRSKKITYSIVDQYHSACLDKIDIITAELAACGGLLRHTTDEVDRKIVEIEIIQLKMVKNSLEEISNNLCINDIPEQAIAANHHLKIQEMQKEFRNILAHELRNSVTPILGLAEIIEARLLENKNGKIELKVQEFEIITRNAKRLQLLVGCLIQYY
ncbi:MAG TPA: histidine kinase dimerization/phospho-acceptor domain-containing protein [Candidatus Acidoferrum sp.]|nr:histidine kinase dimerization/phospho-acceptor domain-containing protein [Candidatus Acidoferrum sp.]